MSAAQNTPRAKPVPKLPDARATGTAALLGRRAVFDRDDDLTILRALWHRGRREFVTWSFSEVCVRAGRTTDNLKRLLPSMEERGLIVVSRAGYSGHKLVIVEITAAGAVLVANHGGAVLDE